MAAAHGMRSVSGQGYRFRAESNKCDGEGMRDWFAFPEQLKPTLTDQLEGIKIIDETFAKRPLLPN